MALHFKLCSPVLLFQGLDEPSGKVIKTTELLMSQQKLPEHSQAFLGLGMVQGPCQVVSKQEGEVWLS